MTAPGVIPRGEGGTWTHVPDKGLTGIRGGQRITNLLVMSLPGLGSP